MGLPPPLLNLSLSPPSAQDDPSPSQAKRPWYRLPNINAIMAHLPVPVNGILTIPILKRFLEGLQVAMLDFRFEKETAFLHLLQEHAGSENGSMGGLEAAEALHRSQRDHGIETDRPDNLTVVTDRNEVNGAFLNPRRHIIRDNPIRGLAQLPIQMTLQGAPDRMVITKRLGNPEPCLFEIFLPIFQCLHKIFRHFHSPGRRQVWQRLPQPPDILSGIINTFPRLRCQRKMLLATPCQRPLIPCCLAAPAVISTLHCPNNSAIVIEL